MDKYTGDRVLYQNRTARVLNFGYRASGMRVCTIRYDDDRSEEEVPDKDLTLLRKLVLGKRPLE